MTKRISTHVPGISKVHRTKGVVYSVRWRDGDRVRGKTFPTMKEAQAFQGQDIKAAKAEGTYADPHAGRVTLAEVAEDWLGKAAQDVRPRTLQGYERTLKLHVLPTFGAKRIDSITSRDVEAWVLGMKGRMPGPCGMRTSL